MKVKLSPDMERELRAYSEKLRTTRGAIIKLALDQFLKSKGGSYE